MIQEPFVDFEFSASRQHRTRQGLFQKLIGGGFQVGAIAELESDFDFGFEVAVLFDAGTENEGRIFDKSRTKILRSFAGKFEGSENAFELEIAEDAVPGDLEFGGDDFF